MKRSLFAVALAAVGFLTGIGLYYLSVFVLFVTGFSFYAVTGGLFLALVVYLIGAPVSYVRLKSRGPQFTQRLMSFLAGMLIFLVVSCAEVAVTTPHTIVPW